MNTNPLVSIVVPVYNAEDGILNCLNSVRNQSYKNLDIIVVDDKSTDGTANLVEKLSGIDKRIRIKRLHKNAGSSFARQCGLNLAHGEYVTFIDADDWYSNDKAIEKALSVFNQNDVDVVMFNFMAWHFKRIAVKRKFKGHGGYYDSLDAIYNKFAFGNPHWLFLWNKIYRIDFIRKNEINFMKGFRWADDSFFNSDILIGGARTYFMKDSYFYTYNCSQTESLSIQQHNFSYQEMKLFFMNSKNHLMILEKEWMPQNHSRRKELALWKKFYKEIMHIISSYGKMDEKCNLKRIF